MTRSEFAKRSQVVSAELLKEHYDDMYGDIPDIESHIRRLFNTNTKNGDRILCLIHGKSHTVFLAFYSHDTNNLKVRMYNATLEKTI